MSRRPVFHVWWCPSFHGRHYYVRAKCWLYLYKMQINSPYKMISARELAEKNDLNLDSLMVMLNRWHAWGKIKCDSTGKVKRYSLGVAGERWLGKYQNDIRAVWPELFYIRKEEKLDLHNHGEHYTTPRLPGYKQKRVYAVKL